MISFFPVVIMFVSLLNCCFFKKSKAGKYIHNFTHVQPRLLNCIFPVFNSKLSIAANSEARAGDRLDQVVIREDQGLVWEHVESSRCAPHLC